MSVNRQHVGDRSKIFYPYFCGKIFSHPLQKFGWSAPQSDKQSVDNKVNCCIVDADVDTELSQNMTNDCLLSWLAVYDVRSWEFTKTFKCPIIVVRVGN